MAIVVLVAGWRHCQNVTGATAAAPAPEDFHAWVVPMPPAPDSLPVVGPEGVDEDGFPRQQVDRVGLLAMLLEGKYAALDAAMNEAQARFEQNPRYEDWAVDAIEAFSNADPRVGAALDAWAREGGSGWAPHAARGSYWRATGWLQRGGYSASETSNDRLRAFAENESRAAGMFREALAAKPTAIGAATELVRTVGRLNDADATRQAYRTAIEACPSCARVRYEYFRARLPRWGGSLDELQQIVADARAQAGLSTRLANFDVVMSAYQCRLHFERDYGFRESTACADAAGRGFYGHMLLYAIQQAMGREEWTQAGALTDRALSLPVARSEVWGRGVQLSLKSGRPEQAGERLLTALRLDASDPRFGLIHTTMGDALVTRAQDLLASGDRVHARRLFEEATWLDDRSSTEAARVRAVMADLDTSPAGLEALRAAQQAQPDSFEATQDLAYVLSESSTSAEILPLWNHYIEAHAQDGRAYRERAATLHALAQEQDAHADLERACALGLHGCCEKSALPPTST
ncbi:MAG: DUF4034 domain-containing protein [Myxococcales bacterium]|nr:DUF4034 domain-containing protein [Myxococcales bacterium]